MRGRARSRSFEMCAVVSRYIESSLLFERSGNCAGDLIYLFSGGGGGGGLWHLE